MTDRYWIDALERAPDDFDLRRVYGDWLEEQGQPHGDGFRAIGVQRRSPGRGMIIEGWAWFCPHPNSWMPHSDEAFVPFDWFVLLPRMLVSSSVSYHPDRSSAELELALAFMKLPEHRRRELLTVPVLCGRGR